LWAMHTQKTVWNKRVDKNLSPCYLKEHSLAEA
jgi:hypothetical protein